MSSESIVPAPPRPSRLAAPVPVIVSVLDRVVDIVAIIVLAALHLRGHLGAEIAAGSIVAVAGVQTGLRQITRSQLGAAGLVLLGVGSLLGPRVAQGLGTTGAPL